MLTLVASSKEKMVNVRLRPETHEEFKIACELRGGSMSSILHQFIVRTIREEKELSPKVFERLEREAMLRRAGAIEVATHSKKRIPLLNPDKLQESKKPDGVKKKKAKRVV